MWLLLLNAFAGEPCQKDEICVYETYWDQCLAKSKAYEELSVAFSQYKSACTLRLDKLDTTLLQHKHLLAEARDEILSLEKMNNNLSRDKATILSSHNELKKKQIPRIVTSFAAGVVVGSVGLLMVANSLQ